MKLIENEIHKVKKLWSENTIKDCMQSLAIKVYKNMADTYAFKIHLSVGINT